MSSNTQRYSFKNLAAASIVFGVIAACGYKWFEILGLDYNQFVVYLTQHSTNLLIAILPFPLILLLSKYFPADKKTPLLHGGMVIDAFYMIIRVLLTVSVFVLIREFMGIAHINYFDSFRLGVPEATPWFLRIVIAFLVADFFFYWYHRLMHQIELLWNFHAIHHSQVRLNFFTDSRAHFFDRLDCSRFSHDTIAFPTTRCSTSRTDRSFD